MKVEGIMFQQLTIVEFFQQGGIVLIFLGVLSVISITIIIKRWFVFSAVLGKSKKYSKAMMTFLDNKRYGDAIKFCQKYPSLIADVYLSILNNRNKPKAEIEEIAQRQVLKILVVLEHKLNFIATVGSTTPFIGLLGTVFGIIKTFLGMSYAHGYSPTVVTSGIAEALLNTAAGLFVAIPAVVAYNYFSYQIRVFLRDAEITISEMIENFDMGEDEVKTEKPSAKVEPEIVPVKVEQKPIEAVPPVKAPVIPAPNNTNAPKNDNNKNNFKNNRR